MRAERPLGVLGIAYACQGATVLFGDGISVRVTCLNDALYVQPPKAQEQPGPTKVDRRMWRRYQVLAIEELAPSLPFSRSLPCGALAFGEKKAT